MDKYQELLKNPPSAARGWTRWWWYGCAVTKEEISRQLGFMKDAEIGGVEIQVLYPVHQNDKSKGIRNIDYFSPEFFDLLRYAVDKAEDLGMGVDFTLGSCWPYGGPFITHEMAPQSVIPYQIDVYGPRSFSFDFTTRINGNIICAVMGRMDRGRMVGESVLDISGYIRRKDLFGWPWGELLEEILIPEGNWKIVAFVSSEYRQTIPAPAPNAGGYAIDHCRRDVSQYFFNTAGKPIVDKIGRGRIQNFFCDSIEVAGHNWTENFFDEFEKRRGYSLEPYIYALWGEVGDVTPYIRYDYYKTMSELTIENFFRIFTGWCNENGSLSRIQAHGTWGDILQAYAAADIPEGETFGNHDRLLVNTIHRRFAASAAHIYNKPIVSNESFTWLRMPRFLETLENMKAAVDAIFLDGINRIYNHGYSYTPSIEGEPGWVFYASSHICHTNTWWPYYKELGGYIRTVSAFLQAGRSVAELAVYLPQADVWSENPMGDLHLAMKLEEYMGRDLMDGINKAGYYFDYINDEALEKLGDYTEKGFVINGNAYKAIILPRVRKIPAASALKLREFVVKGGILLASGCAPDDSCGLLNRFEEKNAICETMKGIFSYDINDIWDVGKGKTVMTEHDCESITSTLRKLIQPDVNMGQHCDTIGYVHRRDDRDEIYFFSNISSEGKTATLELNVTGKGLKIFDPLRREEIYPLGFSFKNGSTQLALEFEPFGSFIAIMSEDLPAAGVKTRSPAECLLEEDITAGWEFRVEGTHTRQLEKIHTWEVFPELKYYSGEGWYTKNICIGNEALQADRVVLKFEKIYEAAEVFVNGQSAGRLWKAPRELDIRKALRPGENELAVKVTNLWINDAINPDKTETLCPGPVIDEWPYFADIINNNRKRRLFNRKEREKVQQPIKSGIEGNAVLKFFKCK